jgi:hypothetical protein
MALRYRREERLLHFAVRVRAFIDDIFDQPLSMK